MAGLAWAGLIVTHNLSALMAVLVLGALLTLLFVFQRTIGVSFLSGPGQKWRLGSPWHAADRMGKSCRHCWNCVGS